MMDSRKDYRKSNGSKVEGVGLAIRVSQEIKGLLLAHAFVIVRSAGFQLRVNKLDGRQQPKALSNGKGEHINVDVFDSFVKSSWSDQPKVQR